MSPERRGQRERSEPSGRSTSGTGASQTSLHTLTCPDSADRGLWPQPLGAAGHLAGQAGQGQAGAGSSRSAAPAASPPPPFLYPSPNRWRCPHCLQRLSRWLLPAGDVPSSPDLYLRRRPDAPLPAREGFPRLPAPGPAGSLPGSPRVCAPGRAQQPHAKDAAGCQLSVRGQRAEPPQLPML